MDYQKKNQIIDYTIFTLLFLGLLYIFVSNDEATVKSLILPVSQVAQFPVTSSNTFNMTIYGDELEEALARASTRDKTVIIAMVNKAYVEGDKPMLDLFLDGFWLGDDTRGLVDHLLIVAADQTSFDRCTFLRLHCYKLETDGVDFVGEKLYMSDDFIKMMWRRTFFLADVLKRGYNFIFTNTTPKPDGRPGAQAVALRTSGDKGAYYNVKAYGFQDTLCDDKGLHFYKDCYFEGTVDFIFGNAKSIYLNTEAHAVTGETEANVITAHARDNPANDVGYSFVQCSVTGTGKKSFLGRTWRSHPTVVFSYTEISDVIDPVGWSNAGKTEFEKTAFFGEFNNKGPGAALTGRPAYVKKLTEVEAKPFVSLSYIQGSKWLLPPITI